MEPRRLQFLHTQGPVARIEWRKATQILRAGRILPGPRGNPRNGVRGKATMSTKCSSGAVPGGVLVTLPPWAKSLAARRRRNPPARNETAPLSPPHPPQCAHWGTFPPGGRLRRAATWGRPYGGNIALKNKKTLSSRDWDESVWFASWCHPISERPGRSLWTPCCGGGAAPVSRPAGGAVFGRVRLRGVLSTWGRSPWDLSLSGGIPVTHAPSWR